MHLSIQGDVPWVTGIYSVFALLPVADPTRKFPLWLPDVHTLWLEHLQVTASHKKKRFSQAGECEWAKPLSAVPTGLRPGL